MTTPPHPDPLVDFGFTPDEAAAFRTLWASRHIVDFLDAIPEVVHEFGGTAEDAVAFIDHAVELLYARLFASHGFNAEQACAILNDSRARRNLFDNPDISAEDFLAVDAPTDYLTVILRTSDEPKAANRDRARWVRAAAGQPMTINGKPDAIADLLAEASLLTMGLHDPCPHRHHHH